MSICNLDHFAETYWQDKQFVLVGGCFDPLHDGHLGYFEEARSRGPLVCAVMPNADVAQKRTVCLDEWTRVKVLNACALIEHVHLAVQGIPAVIRALKPSHYVIGEEYYGKLPAESVAACHEVGTRIVYVDCRAGSSSERLAYYERRRNAEKLAALESFVRQQKPADKPWEPVTDYSAMTRRAIEAPQADIIRREFEDCHVFDYGCGFGYLVEMLRERGMNAAGWDPKLHPDQEVNGFWIERGYDLVICREVLEHLSVRQLTLAVRNLVKLSSKYVYVTTRFTDGSHLLDVDGADTLDPTHMSMLNQDLLRTLFVLEGCTRRADLEQKLDHLKKGRVLVYEVPRD